MKIKLLILGFITYFISNAAFAETYVGVPKGAHYNGAVAGRGICVQLRAPSPVPPGSAWFCNYSAGNSLFNEINRVLEEASLNQKNCGIGSSSIGPGSFHKIEFVNCPNFIAAP